LLVLFLGEFIYLKSNSRCYCLC